MSLVEQNLICTDLINIHIFINLIDHFGFEVLKAGTHSDPESNCQDEHWR